MCTIMTISRTYFEVNKEQVLASIIKDSLYNSDGFSLLLMGEYADDQSIVRTMNINTITNLLVADKNWSRAFIHCRMATTVSHGVTHTHAFAAGDWVIFHNGILRHPDSKLYDVDSEFLADAINVCGFDEMLVEIKDESYVNAFFINTKTGLWHLVRKTTNTLYTDGKGNYSTNKTGRICKLVPVNKTFSWQIPMKVIPTILGKWDKWPTYTAFPPYFPSEEEDVAETVSLYTDPDDFYDLAMEMRWHEDRIENRHYRKLSNTQKGWLDQLRKRERRVS